MRVESVIPAHVGGAFQQRELVIQFDLRPKRQHLDSGLTSFAVDSRRNDEQKNLSQSDKRDRFSGQ